MALTIPDYANATFPEQAAPDSVDFDAIVAGYQVTGIVSGLVVSQRAAGANLSVDVSAGSGYVAGTLSTLGSTSNQAVTADATNPRWALVSFGAGAVTVTLGTAAASPVFPAIPAGKVLLAAVWIPANAASILNANITDKRVILGATPATSVQTETALDAGQVGTSLNWAREDHRHPVVGLVDLSTSQTISGVKTTTAGTSVSTTYGNIASPAGGIVMAAGATATATNVVARPGSLIFQTSHWDGATAVTSTPLIKANVMNSSGRTRFDYAAGEHQFLGDVVIPSGLAFTTGTRSIVTGTRGTSTNASDTVDLGIFSSTGGAIELHINTHLAAPAAGTTASVTKAYEIAVNATMGTLNTWYKVLPVDMSANQATSNDFALEVRRTAAGTFEFRFRQISIGAIGNITFTIETLGDTAVTFTPSTTVTAAPAAVTTLHPSNSMVTAAGNVGIGTDTPTTYPFELNSGTISPNVGMLRSSDAGHSKLLIRNDDAGTNVNIGLFGSTPGTGIFTEAGIASADAFIATANTALRIGGFGQASHMRVSPTVTKLVNNVATTQGNTGANVLQLQSEAAATAVNTLQAAGRIEWKANYWNGAASVQSGPSYIAHTVTSTGGAQTLVYSSSRHEFSGDPQVNDGTNTRSIPRGPAARWRATANSAAIGTTETIAYGSAFTVNLISGRRYRFRCRFRYVPTATSTTLAAQVRIFIGTTLTGIVSPPSTGASPVTVALHNWANAQTAGTYTEYFESYDLIAGTDIPSGSQTVSVAVQAAAGTITAQGGTTIDHAVTMITVDDASA